MLIEIDLRHAAPALTLCDPDDFGAFKIVGRGPATDTERRVRALERLGRVTPDGHVFVSAETLVTMAGDHAREPHWLTSLEAMHAYAREHGWTDDTGAIRGHVQWTP
jgi:hypothetical protein